jgi:hypothetical protein
MFTTILFESKSEMVPAFDVPIQITTIETDLIKKLEHIIEAEEADIMQKFKPLLNTYTDGIPDNGISVEDWVTNRAFEFNLLKYTDKYPETIILKNKIYENYKSYAKELNLSSTPVYAQVWFNVLRKNGRYFTRHHHAHRSRVGEPNTAYISGHICIRAENTNTYYFNPFIENECVPIPNIVGEVTLFPSWVNHSTDQNKSETSRLTVAFDIITETEYKKGLMDNPNNYILLE